jgi:hypothetical protein
LVLVNNGTSRFAVYQNCHRFEESLFNSVLVRMLIGEENYGNKFQYTNYTDEVDPIHKAIQILEFRRAHLHTVNQMIRMDKNDVWLQPLQMSCNTNNSGR